MLLPEQVLPVAPAARVAEATAVVVPADSAAVAQAAAAVDAPAVVVEVAKNSLFFHKKLL